MPRPGAQGAAAVPPSGGAATRVGWVDTARGIAIIAVVMFHSAIFLAAAGSAWRWDAVMQSLETFRMPLFFFAAGLFAAKIVTQTFGQLWRGRLAVLIYLYVLWSALRWVFFQFVPFALSGGDPSDIRELLSIFVWLNGGLWFLYALALYSVFVWSLRAAPVWVPIGLSILVTILFSSRVISVDNDSWMKVGSYVAFFVVAVFARSWVLRAAPRVTAVAVVALVVAYLLLAAGYQLLDLRTAPGVRFVVSVAGVTAGLALAIGLSRARALSGLSWLGRRTLPIYLVHYLPIAAAAATLIASGIRLPDTAGAVAVPLLAAVAIAVSLLVHSGLARVHGVFDLPRIGL